MCWAALGCLNYFVNSIIWNSHAMNVAPEWCEISIRIILAENIAIPAASLCINRRLFCILTLKSVNIDKRRAVWEDLAIGILLPLLGISLGTVRSFIVYRSLIFALQPTFLKPTASTSMSK